MALVGTDQGSDVQKKVLPDGTLYQKIVLNRKGSDSVDRETLETFEGPSQRDLKTEVIEKTMPDGTRMQCQVSMSRMVHSVKTRRESFDESSGHKVEQFELEEVVPNTMSAFDAGQDSDYEDEVKQGRRMSVEQNFKEIEEVLPDGTKVKRQVTLSRVVQGKRDAHLPSQGGASEVIPGTISAFQSGQDSDDSV